MLQIFEHSIVRSKDISCPLGTLILQHDKETTQQSNIFYGSEICIITTMNVLIILHLRVWVSNPWVVLSQETLCDLLIPADALLEREHFYGVIGYN